MKYLKTQTPKNISGCRLRQVAGTFIFPVILLARWKGNSVPSGNNGTLFPINKSWSYARNGRPGKKVFFLSGLHLRPFYFHSWLTPLLNTLAYYSGALSSHRFGLKVKQISQLLFIFRYHHRKHEMPSRSLYLALRFSILAGWIFRLAFRFSILAGWFLGLAFRILILAGWFLGLALRISILAAQFFGIAFRIFEDSYLWDMV